jgi:DNA helicase IV
MPHGHHLPDEPVLREISSKAHPSQVVSSRGDGSEDLSGALSVAEDRHGPDPTLRAEALVREIVSRPRTGKLSALLATLQEDQFDLVSWPADKPLIISGQPGTGKTVVALHRAAYLTHSQRAGGPLKRVVVVGPSEEYREHVHLVSEAAGGRRVPVVGVNELLCQIAGIDFRKVEPGQHDRLGVDWKLRTVALMAARRMSDAQGKRDLFDRTLHELLSPGVIHRECVKDKDLSDWLLAIESPEAVRRQARYLPLAAAVGLATRNTIDDQVDHLIVDEAQDVPPLVWLLMLSLLKANGSLTILGDLNQRRSDWTASSWDQLAQDLEISDEDGRAPVRELTTGYRSTREILKFANQLLVRDERRNYALREGTPPVVERVGRKELVDAVTGRARELSDKRGAGLTAIISVDPRPFSDAFRQSGWRRPADLRDAWTNGDSIVFVLHPDRARGLEFDSVIVVEPDAFPKNVGREGVLYTSLTRATLELHVLYAGKLPNNLRPPRVR